MRVQQFFNQPCSPWFRHRTACCRRLQGQRWQGRGVPNCEPQYLVSRLSIPQVFEARGHHPVYLKHKECADVLRTSTAEANRAAELAHFQKEDAQ